MIQSEIYRGRTRTVQDAVDAWKAHYFEAEEVKDVEAIVLEALYSFDILFEWQSCAWTLLRAGKLKKVLEVGQKLRDAYKTGSELFAAVNDCVKWAEGKGYVVDKADALRKASRQIRVFCDELEAKWPFPDRQKIDEGLASLNRGQGIEIGEWLSELQGENCPVAEKRD